MTAAPRSGPAAASSAATAPAREAAALRLADAPPLPGRYARVVKPLVDRTVACLVLLVLSPLLLLLAAAVLLTSGRPVLFRQQRVGQDAVPFAILKFRTMRPDRRTDQIAIGFPDRRGYHKSDDDPRHTRFGRLLRRTSLDELPQLANVAGGSMSLVGPRPELPCVVAQYEPWQHRRHLVRPGLTGPWQVSARGDGPMHDHVHLDVRYVDALSLRTDVGLLVRTLPALLRRRGA